MINEELINEIRNKPAPQKALIDYDYNGKLQSFHCWADSREDAKARLEAIKETGRVEGYPVWTIPVPLPLSTPRPILRVIGDILVRIVAFFKA